jgi:hypothetical protein
MWMRGCLTVAVRDGKVMHFRRMGGLEFLRNMSWRRRRKRSPWIMGCARTLETWKRCQYSEKVGTQLLMVLWIAREHFWSKKRYMQWGRDTLSFSHVIARLPMPRCWTVTQNAMMGEGISCLDGNNKTFDFNSFGRQLCAVPEQHDSQSPRWLIS